MKFSSVISLSTSRTADPASAGIDRFVGLEHIEPENLHIRSWGLVADGTTFTNTLRHGNGMSAATGRDFLSIEYIVEKAGKDPNL